MAVIEESGLLTNSVGLLDGDLVFIFGRNTCFSNSREYDY